MAAAATGGEPDGGLPRIVLFGATGRLGRPLLQRFHHIGHPTLSLGRRKTELRKLTGDTMEFNLHNHQIGDVPIMAGDIVINAVHAKFTAVIVKLCPPNIRRLIVIGSTRHLTRFPDPAAGKVRAAAECLVASELPWVLLHPTMIYGAAGEQNVQRIAALIRQFHIIPLPGGGRSLIQPVHVSDVVEAVVRTAGTSRLDRQVYCLGGPEAIPYHAFVRAIADALGTWVWIVPVPPVMLRLAAWLSSWAWGIQKTTDGEILRLQEDKNVDSGALFNLLGFQPRSLAQGLKEAFEIPTRQAHKTSGN